MTRLVLGILLVAVLAACTQADSGPGPGGKGGTGETERFKAEMDALAQELLPDLVAAVGGQLRGMQASFYEAGSWGVWDYTAMGRITEVKGDPDQALDAARKVLEEHGLTLSDNPIRDIDARTGNLSVTLVRAGAGSSGELEIEMGNVDALETGDDYAEDAAPEDYLTFVR